VYLPQSLFPGDKVVLDIGFMVKIAKVNHRTGVTEHTVNLGDFYPILCGEKNGGFYECAYYNIGDPFYQDVADYQLQLKLPKEYTVATTGEIVGEKTLESKKEYTMVATNARNFAIVASDSFKTISKEVNGKTLSYYYHTDQNAAESLAAAAESFAYFEETFGEYPYESYALAETGLCENGMDYTALSMIASDLSQTDRARAIVHETAHQWWGITVGNDQTENAWQDEGLCEYSAVCFFENYEKYGIMRETVVQDALREYRSYYDVYGSVLGRKDTAMTKHLKDYISGYEYKCLAYDKSVVMLDTLRKSVGDKKFFGGLKKYYKENALRMTIPEHLIGAYERTGVDANGFFESFLNGKAIL
jgi:aminopeptidase N